MRLTKEQKNRIIDEIEVFKNEQYANLTLKERQKLGQFFTPGELVVKMVEKFNDLDDETYKQFPFFENNFNFGGKKWVSKS